MDTVEQYAAEVAKKRKALPESEPESVDAHVVEPKHAGGRPNGYTEDLPAMVMLSIPDGATWDAVANVCSCSITTAKRWADEHAEFKAAINTARAICDDRVERSLFRKATGYTVTQQVYDKRTGNIRQLEVSVPGDTVACIFFLKNRRPRQWRDVHQIDLTVEKDRPSLEEMFAELDSLRSKALEKVPVEAKNV